MKRVEKRKSNFECMRIVSMLLIIGHHLGIHGVQHFLEKEVAYSIWSTGTTLNKAFTCFLLPGGGIGVALFFMIAGYFQIDRDKKDLTQIILSPFFYGSLLCVLYIVLMLAGASCVNDLSFRSMVLFGIRTVFNPATGENWWFVTAYFFLMLISPLLNHFLSPLDKKSMLAFIILFWIIWYSIPCFTSNTYSSVLKGIFYYMLGAFCRRFLEQNMKGIRKVWLFIFVTIIWLVGSGCFYVTSYIAGMDTMSIGLSIAWRFFDMFFVCVVTPLGSLGIFLLFAFSDIGSIKWINRIGGTTFGVYLIHDAGIARTLIWHTILQVDTIQYASSLFPIYAILSIVGVFCCCSLIDLGRKMWVEPWMTEQFRGLMKHVKSLCVK